MSSRVGLTKPNDHIVVVQMISDSLVVKVCTLRHPAVLLCQQEKALAEVLSVVAVVKMLGVLLLSMCLEWMLSHV